MADAPHRKQFSFIIIEKLFIIRSLNQKTKTINDHDAYDLFIYFFKFKNRRNMFRVLESERNECVFCFYFDRERTFSCRRSARGWSFYTRHFPISLIVFGRCALFDTFFDFPRSFLSTRGKTTRKSQRKRTDKIVDLDVENRCI